MLITSGSAYPRDLHSFPTRRSSDLQLRLETYEGFPPRTPPLAAIDEAVGRTPKRSLAAGAALTAADLESPYEDRKSTRLNSSHTVISYAVFCLKKKTRSSSTGGRCA